MGAGRDCHFHVGNVLRLTQCLRGPGHLYFAEYVAVVKECGRAEAVRTMTTRPDGKINGGEDFQAFHPAAGD